MRITDIHFYSRALIVGEPGRLYISAWISYILSNYHCIGTCDWKGVSTTHNLVNLSQHGWVWCKRLALDLPETHLQISQASPIGLPKLNILLNTSRKVTTITTILQQPTQVSGTSWISKTMCEYKLNKHTREDCGKIRLQRADPIDCHLLVPGQRCPGARHIEDLVNEVCDECQEIRRQRNRTGQWLMRERGNGCSS